MEKFDKHIKTKLEERRAIPSEEAWNKIQARLPLNKKSDGIRKYVWAIAASFIGILLVSVLFYQQEQPNPVIDPVVDKTTVEDAFQEESRIVEKTESKEKVSKEIEARPLVVKNEEEPLEETVVGMDTPDQKTTPPIKDIPIEKSLDVISIKANEVFAQVEALESMSLSGVTDAEVDSLLRVAQEQILAEKIFDQNGKVDAMALLTEVEDELDESFRDHIFDALKEGYLKLRTAVADRNK